MVIFLFRLYEQALVVRISHVSVPARKIFGMPFAARHSVENVVAILSQERIPQSWVTPWSLLKHISNGIMSNLLNREATK